VGDPAAPSPVDAAFADDRAFLGDRGAGAADEAFTASGIIDRFAQSGDRIYFTLRGRRGVFSAPDSSDPERVLARPGDRVRVRAVPDAGGLLSVRDLRDDSIAR